jgi:type I restriction enzyme R subunit
MSELDQLLEAPITPEEWQQALTLATPRKSFTLWAIKRQFCTRRSDFLENYGLELRIDEVLAELEQDGFIQRDGEDYSLTAEGEFLALMFGPGKLSDYAQLAREDAAIARRFADVDKQRVEIPEDAPDSTEFALVEEPLIKQLKKLGWTYLEGDQHVPYLTERESFREVLLMKRLRAALRKINLDDSGKEWLDETRINQAIDTLQRAEGHRLMEINESVTKMLLVGVDVDGVPEIDQGRPRRVKFIDFDHPERNDFLAINQFRVNAPGEQRYITPDLALLVNGVPLVVVECKSPMLTNPVEEAITQLRRYSNQRTRMRGEVNLGPETFEGAETLFHYNQLLIATCFFEARAGSVSSGYEHFLEWKDTYPLEKEEVAGRLGVQKLTSQQMLVAGMLAPAHLLDIVRNFILFQETGGRKVKLIPRYVQFRAVRKAVERLENGKTKDEQGETDGRGGIVWHTQGSGKSLTMVFLIRKMRRSKKLRSFKVVVVTDRRDLQEQLSDTAMLTGERPSISPSIEVMKNTLRRDSPDLVFTTIQKLRPENEAAQSKDQEAPAEDFGVLNASPEILLLIDEAHRSHDSEQHGALMRALPNAAKIGFTGTPILTGARKKTEAIFGPFLDRYNIKQSEEDGATVPILYEGRSVEGEVVDKQSLDFYFEEEFRGRSEIEKAAIKRLYANQPQVAKAWKLIAAKAEDMLRHYVSTVMPEGLKAQVVTVDRDAAVRYQQAFVEAKKKLLAELKALDPALLKEDGSSDSDDDDRLAFLKRAYEQLPQIERLEFGAVISGVNNDPELYEQWNATTKHQRLIERFKRDLVNQDASKQDGLAFLCVASMLLTGFDAPVEGVLYLDRAMNQPHELLQTVARVNRTHRDKARGLVVDYHNVALRLKEALAVYSLEDVVGALMSLKDELPLLADRHRRARAVFIERNLEISNVQACVELLELVEIRADFMVKLKKFLRSLNIVLPRPEGLAYVADAKQLGLINRVAARLYRDEEINLMGVGEKVRRLIDEYVEARGIRVEIPPVSITDPKFDEVVKGHESDRSKASEMEHALRYHITRNLQKDPIFYKKMSERLEDILRQFADNWQSRLQALRELREEIERGRQPNEFGLDIELEARFYDILVEEARKERELRAEQRADMAEMTAQVVTLLLRHLRRVDFWRNPQSRTELQRKIASMLDDHRVVSLDRQEAVADRLVELAKALNERLTK